MVQAWPCDWDGLIRDRAPIAPDVFSVRESQPARSERKDSFQKLHLLFSPFLSLRQRLTAASVPYLPRIGDFVFEDNEDEGFQDLETPGEIAGDGHGVAMVSGHQLNRRFQRYHARRRQSLAFLFRFRSALREMTTGTHEQN